MAVAKPASKKKIEAPKKAPAKKRAPRKPQFDRALFIAEYLRTNNATKAAIAAGYSEKTARQQGSRLLSNVDIRAEIQTERRAMVAAAKVDAQDVLSRLKNEVEADIADLFDDEGKLLPVWEWPLVWRQGLISGIEVEELWEGRGEDRVQVGMLRKVKISDRLKRIELIGKHVGVQAFKERLEVDTTEDLAARLQRARERAIGNG